MSSVSWRDKNKKKDDDQTRQCKHKRTVKERVSGPLLEICANKDCQQLIRVIKKAPRLPDEDYDD
jgi:hypothetical protein